MQFLRKFLMGCWICGLLALCPAGVWAQTHNQFVYVNDNPGLVANSIEGFAVASNGVLTALPGSPYLTGGRGGGAGFPGVSRLALRTIGNFLYVSNDSSNDISIFKLNPTTGIPTLSAGPVPTGGRGGSIGFGLAVSPDGKFLFALNGGSCNISAFSIGPAGGLAPVAGSPFSTSNTPLGMMVTHDGKFVINASFQDLVDVFAIATDGSLTPVTGSPFNALGPVSGLESDCSGQHLFAGDVDSAGIFLEIYTIGSDGSLTPIPSSPFFPHGGTGFDSENVVLNSSGHLLYISNRDSASVTTARVNETTSALSLVPGDPFPNGSSFYQPSGISVDPASRFVFTANLNPTDFSGSALGVLAATGDGKLVPVPGSPFLLAVHSRAQSVQAFPTKTCKP